MKRNLTRRAKKIHWNLVKEQSGHVGKLHEIQSLPKARGIRNSKEKKARWKYGCISTKACLRQEDAFFSWDGASKMSALLSFFL